MSSLDHLRIQVTRPGDLVAVVPRLMGFRYDMPPTDVVPQVAEHATSVLRRRDIPQAVLVGYGPGTRVTPRMDILRTGFGRAEDLRPDPGLLATGRA
jgi:hypothetical protein